MTSATHEHTLNVALGEVLGRLRQSWTTRTEQIGNVLVEGGRPDILIEEASGWPVVIEAERSSHASAENDANRAFGQDLLPAPDGRSRPQLPSSIHPTSIHLTALKLRDAIVARKTLSTRCTRIGSAIRLTACRRRGGFEAACGTWPCSCIGPAFRRPELKRWPKSSKTGCG